MVVVPLIALWGTPGGSTHVKATPVAASLRSEGGPTDGTSLVFTAAASNATPATPVAASAAPTNFVSLDVRVVKAVVHRLSGSSASRPAARPAPRAAPTRSDPPPPSQTGPASWYPAPPGTCAHQTLPMGTVVTVTDLGNGRQTTCKVEDRGPYQDGRIIDLSKATFAQLAPPSEGVIQVRITW